MHIEEYNIQSSYEVLTQEEVNELTEALSKHGYVFETKEQLVEGEMKKLVTSGKLKEEVAPYVGKCKHCKQYVEAKELRTHGRTCEHCGEVLYKEVDKGSLIRFAFYKKLSGIVTLKVHEYDAKNHIIYFDKFDIPEQDESLLRNKRSIFSVLDLLEQFKPLLIEKQVGLDTLIGVPHNFGYKYGETPIINIHEIIDGEIKHANYMYLFKGKEYQTEEGVELPIPMSIHIDHDWMFKKTARILLLRVGIEPRPSFYSKRGATTDDVNASQLQEIYNLMYHCNGENQAQQFIQLVKDLPVFSATNFIKALMRLEMNNWEWHTNLLQGLDGVSLDDQGSAETTALLGIIGNKQDDTYKIKAPFLKKHGVHIKPNVYKCPQKNGEMFYIDDEGKVHNHYYK